jgi:hypothetical protein
MFQFAFDGAAFFKLSKSRNDVTPAAAAVTGFFFSAGVAGESK